MRHAVWWEKLGSRDISNYVISLGVFYSLIFQNKGVELGILQILCTKVPGYTHWKINTQEFLLSATLTSVKCVHVTK